MGYHLDPIDKPGLLISFMRAFAGDQAHISLEGDLSTYELDDLEGATANETAVLKRQTIDPVLDLVVAPLTTANASVVAKAVSRKNGISNRSGLIHVQISKADRLVFGGYDNFHPHCVFVDHVPEKFLEQLKESHVIRGFELANDV